MKPEMFFDEELAALGSDTILFFIGLFTQADKEGRLEERQGFLRANIFPYRPDFDVEHALDLLHPKFVFRYEVDGRKFLWIRNFQKHQRIGGKELDTESAFPPPPKTHWEAQGKQWGSTREAPEKHLGAQEGKGREGKGKEGKGERSAPTPRAAFSKPTAVEVIEYSKGLGKPIDGEAFVAFYESKGWVIGKSPMKNWKAAVVTWTKRDRNGATRGKPRPGEPGYVTTDTDRVIHGFRLAKKIPTNDKAWVKNMWEQQRPHAQRLLDYFAGNWRSAVDCIGHTATKREGMEWGWPAVMNIAPEFKNAGVTA